MLQFDEIEYELVENILLGEDKFNSLQKEFIELFKTKFIIAGPGTGKTTSLTAKITLLLRYLNKIGSKEGICIITHTNVAVKEINGTLQKAGVTNVTHPHFIGTIHEFFNKYCVLPFFKKEYKHDSLLFDEDAKGDVDYYYNYLNRSRHSFMQEGAKKYIAKKIHESSLVFDVQSKSIRIENSSNWPKFERYEYDAFDAKLSRKSKGFLQYDDTFLFSEAFLSNTNFIKMLRKRFKYIFVDEFQDTSPKGLELLKSIFMSKECILQMIGDPYQTILYGQPMPEIDENQVFQLNITNRFGDEIAVPLNTIMPEANIQTLESKKSFPPILLIYQDESKIYTSYKKIIREYEEVDVCFRSSKMVDKILVRNRDWASRLIEGVKYNNSKSNSLEPENVQLKNKIIDFIYKEMKSKKGNSIDFKIWLKNHPRLILMHSLLIDILKYGLNEERKQALKCCINEFLGEKQIEGIDLNASLFKELEDIVEGSIEIKKEDNFESSKDLSTIHSVKGKTLRSALVVNFNNAPLTNILFHRYGITDNVNYNYHDHNLLYVAMSRVAYLFVYAIHKDEVNEKVIKKLKNHWTIRKTQ